MMMKTPKPLKTLTFPTAEDAKAAKADQKPKYPPAPRFLSRTRKEFWRRVVREWDLADQDLEVLRLACSMLDRADEARAAILSGGVVKNDRFGQVVENPACRVERASSLAAARLLKQLDLVDGVPAPPGRPPKGGGGRLDVK